MKKSFTMVELIFVIVIIGLLASYAIPKFMATSLSASAASAASTVSSVRTSVETAHGAWIIDDTLDSSNGYTPQGYPIALDDSKANTIGVYLFEGNSTLTLLKKGVKSCNTNNCWMKMQSANDENISDYNYKFTKDDNITLEYNGSNGKFECIEKYGSITKDKCESLIK